MDSPRKNTGVGYHFLFQGIVPIQGSNLSLLSLVNWRAGSLPLAPPGKPADYLIQSSYLATEDSKVYRKEANVYRTQAFRILVAYALQYTIFAVLLISLYFMC